MATWYAQSSTHWTDPDVSGPSAGQGIWNDAAGGGGTWGTPAAGDTCDLNGQTVTWDSGTDGPTFANAATIQGSGSFFFTPSSTITITSSLTIASTFGGGVSGTVTTSGAITVTFSGTGSSVSWTMEVASSGTLHLSGSFGNQIVVDSGATVLHSSGTASGGASISGIYSQSGGSVTTSTFTINAGGVWFITGATTISGTHTNNGVVAAVLTVSVGVSGNPVVFVPVPGDTINGTTYGVVVLGSAAEAVGDYVSPATSNVKNGVHYGPSSSLTGTYTAAGGGVRAQASTSGGINQ